MNEDTARNTEKTRKRNEKQIMKSRKKDKAILADIQKAVVNEIIDNVTLELGCSGKSVDDSIQNGMLFLIPFTTKNKKEKRKRKRPPSTKTEKKKGKIDVSQTTVDEDSSSPMLMPGSDIDRNPPSVDKESSATAFPNVKTESKFSDFSTDLEMTGSRQESSSSFQGRNKMNNTESIHPDCENMCFNTAVNTSRDGVNEKPPLLTNATTTSPEVTKFLTYSVKNMTSEALKDRNFLPNIILPDVFQSLDDRQREQLEYVTDIRTRENIQEDISTKAKKVHPDVEGITENTAEESITSIDQREYVQYQSSTNIQCDAKENKIY